LKKLGLRVRPRTTSGERRDTPRDKVDASREKASKISFDERGNARLEWTSQHLNEDSDTGERLRDAALFHPGLSMTDDHPPANAPIRSNPKGLRQGYNPYESGLLSKKERKPKRNLRELSDWIEAQRKRNSRPPEKD